ncbi:hypothetical protein F0562_015830 [Nyssa sinensis]|uniref:WRC domain-containing protein n=1 Tax=Nyssa sinensis TaxID=561372 RepID=A0A5J4ZM37_9ASTE|nr:hypothetical protein F0562_015830 [Nyssa sinensis]
MRIRKRCPPPSPPPLTPSPPDLQSSTLQPLPSSESRPLHHRNHLSADDNNSLTHRRDSPNQSLRPPKENEDRQRSDLEFVAVSKTKGWICSNNDVLDEKMSVNQDPPIGIGEDEATAEEKRFILINRRIGYDPSVESSAVSSISSSISHQDHWCEEDKIFPVKKRRLASFTSKLLREATIMDTDRKKMTVRERRKSKKISADDNDEEDGVVEKDSTAKKRGRNGSKIREGSRCSRMNGRGWRCCQPTLVGYSLCEHHLGKGKLRSVNTVGRRTTSAKINNKKVDTSLYVEDDDGDDDDDEKGLMVAERSKRTRTLKARSMSSLLGLTPPPPPPVTL